MIEHRRPVIRLGLRDDDDVIEQHVRVGVLRDQHVGGDHVAGMQFAQDVRVLELVGHGHRIHEAGNGFMVQRDLAGCGIGRQRPCRAACKP